MKPPNFPRRRYLVDNLQYRILLVSLLYVFAVVVVFTAILFVPLVMALEMESLDSPVLRDAAREFVSLHNRVWPPVILLVVLLVAHNVLFSHRIAGPLYRIRHDLKRVGDGNLFVQVKLRKNDYLEKEATSINDMIEALRAKIRCIDQNQKKAIGVLNDLQRALLRGAADEMTDQIDDLGGILEQLKQSVEQFQLPREVARVPEAVPEETPTKSMEPVGAGVSRGV
jgi:methyl-accepting chemotaxis protein